MNTNMSSESTFVKDLMISRLSSSSTTPAPVIPETQKETVQSMVRRRVIGLNRECMVSVSDESKKSSYQSEERFVTHQRDLTPEEMRLKMSLKEFQEAKLKEISAKAAKTEEQNARYDQKMMKIKRQIHEKNQSELLKKMKRTKKNARLSSIKYQKWLKKQANEGKKQTDEDFQRTEDEIDGMNNELGQTVSSSEPKHSAMHFSNNVKLTSSSFCDVMSQSSSFKLNSSTYSFKFRKDLPELNTVNDSNNSLNNDIPLKFSVADNSSAGYDALGSHTADKQTRDNLLEEGIFNAISPGTTPQASATSSADSACDGSLEFFDGEEVDGSCRPVDDLLEENDAFVRLLEMADEFPANSEGASALRVLCTLDQSTFAALLSNKTLHWTPAGKIVLHIFKQRDEPLIPAPVQRVFNTHIDNNGAPSSSDSENMRSEGRSRAPVESNSGVQAEEGYAGLANITASNFPDIEVTIPGTCGETDAPSILENLSRDTLHSRVNENLEQDQISNVDKRIMNSTGYLQTDSCTNHFPPTSYETNYNSVTVPLDNVMPSFSSSSVSYMESQPTINWANQLPNPSDFLTVSDCSTILCDSSISSNYSDAGDSLNFLETTTGNAISSRCFESTSEDYVDHPLSLQLTVQNEHTTCPVESNTREQVPSGVIIQTQETQNQDVTRSKIALQEHFEFFGCQSKVVETHNVLAANPTAEVSFETPSVDEFSLQIQSEPYSVTLNNQQTQTGVYYSLHGDNSSTSLNNNSLPMSPPANKTSQKSLKFKYHHGSQPVQNPEFSSHEASWKTSEATCFGRPLEIESVAPVAYEECNSPEPQDTCQSNQLTQEEFEAINGDGSGPIMLQVLP